MDSKVCTTVSSSREGGEHRHIVQFSSHAGLPIATLGQMPWDRRHTAALLVCAVGITRFLFRSRYLYDIDSVNFALALNRFDPSVHQPHPPGYYLYVYLGRLAQLIFPDANTALVAVSILASCAAAGLIFALADSWFGRTAAVSAGLIFLVSPLA